MSSGGSRQYAGLDDSSFPPLAKATALESQGTFKYALKKKKNTSQWAPFNAGVGESASEGGSASEKGLFFGPPTPSFAAVTSAAKPTTTTATTSTATATAVITVPTTVTDTASTTATPAAAVTALTTAPAAAIPTPTATATAITAPAAAAAPTTTATHIHCANLAVDPVSSPTVVSSTPSQESSLVSGPVPSGFNLPYHLRQFENELNPTPTQYSFHQVGEDLSGINQFNPWLAREYLVGDVMASAQSSNVGNDAEESGLDFNSLEWDPDLPGAPAQVQPQNPTVHTPQPIAYTTVGSIVNPNATPQFTAPNRIQREGSGRRGLLPMLQARYHDSFFQRGLSPFAQSQNDLDLSHTPPPPNSAPSSRSARSLQHTPALAEQENGGAFKKIYGPAVPRMFSGNHMSSPATPTPSHKGSQPPTGTIQSAQGGKDLVEEELGRLGGNFPVQGLEKMQTLQRLAKFENPVQNFALSRLSEFSVARSQGVSTRLDNPTVAVDELLRLKTQTSRGPLSGAENNTGELDTSYKFPVLGMTGPSSTHANPLFGAFSPSTMRSSAESTVARSGYPAPLTAGPPGQRQFQGFVSRPHATHTDNFPPSYLRSSMPNPYSAPSAQTSSLWPYGMDGAQQYVTHSVVPSHYGGGCNSNLQDTAPIPVVSKYYPRGLPGDMTGKVVPLPYLTQRNMGQIREHPGPQTPEEEADNLFYGGQRRFVSMSAIDHIHDHEERYEQSVNPAGYIGVAYKKPLPAAQNEPLAVDTINNMPINDAAAPLLDAAFGALLNYASNVNTPDSGRVLSKFESSPAWLLDTSERGNSSFYGEDWGPPPKRIGRDPRYQTA